MNQSGMSYLDFQKGIAIHSTGVLTHHRHSLTQQSLMTCIVLQPIQRLTSKATLSFRPWSIMNTVSVALATKRCVRQKVRHPSVRSPVLEA